MRRHMSLALLLLFALAMPAAAQDRVRPRGPAPDRGVEQRPIEQDPTRASVVYTAQERSLIENYYRGKGTPPVLQPPGVSEAITRGNPLPIATVRQTLPNELLTHMPNRPGFESRIVGYDVVLVDLVGNIVRDVVVDALRK